MRYFLLLAAVAFSALLRAQSPANDNCSGFIDLGTAPVCTPTVYNNVNATASDIGAFNAPPCLTGGAPTHDVWFAFTCPDTLFDFRITLTATGGQPIRNPQLMLYRGSCAVNGLALLRCDEDGAGSGTATFDIDGLSGGLRYFLRVSDYTPAGNPPNWGQFTLCVDKIPSIVTIDQGGSSLCSGTLYDSGGPDGDYSFGEDFTFTICPDQPNVQCIEFNLEYFFLEQGLIFGFGDYLTFYDGPNVNSPQIAQIGGSLFDEESTGGGGVCYTVQATSGCMTIQFTSDAFNEYQGWKGSWTCSSSPCDLPPTLSIDNNVSAQDIENVLNTASTPVKITKINCPSGALGIFSLPTANSPLNMSKGLLLTSGSTVNALGPNDLTDAGTELLTPGDADLDYLSGIGGAESFDACVVELDVVATTDELTFEYVFGSEEYPEFANDVFNDIFAFLISGPGIVGDPGLGGAKNIAVIPGTTTSVEINSINAIVNWPYYRPNPINGPTLQYDGFAVDSFAKKKSLTARATVIPCNTYHLKLAIADRFDYQYDSGVFISEIKGGAPDIVTAFDGNLPDLIESCTPPDQTLLLSIPDPLPDPIKYYVAVSGTAVRNVDYVSTLPDSVTFSPGQTSLQFSISQINDLIAEGAETVIIRLYNDFGCGTVVFDTLTFLIRDQVEVNITAGDTLELCAGTSPQVVATGALDYFWTPPGAVSDPFIANPNVINATQSFYLKVEGSIGTCTDTDSVWVNVRNPQLDVLPLPDSTLCLGDAIQLVALSNVPEATITWSPAEGLSDPNSLTPTATVSQSTYYVATLSFGACTVSDSVRVLVDTLFFPNVIGDTTVCQGNPVRLANVLNSTTQYQWLPTIGLSDSFSSGPIALPSQTTTYTLTATSPNAYCSRIEAVTVTVKPSDVDILGADSVQICLGTSVPLTAVGTPAGAATVQWSPTFYVSPSSGPSTTATADESVTIYATYNVAGCVARDSVHIRVDSLPTSGISLVPVKPIYCPGDTVLLVSKTYEPANFPDIMHEWVPFGGQETERELWNMVITATVTHTFVRVTTNNACSVTDTVTVPVGVRPVVNITATPNSICAGTEVQIKATVDPDQKLMWKPDPLLSCTDCPDPKVSPTITTTFEVTTPDATCPGGGSITVIVVPPPPLNLPPNPTICLGDSVLLNNVPVQPGATYVWQASSGLAPVGVNPYAAPTVPTTYTVTATGQCVGTGSVTITPVTASVSASEDQSLCYGDAATLVATVNSTVGGLVTWQPGGFVGNNYTTIPTSTTLYTATLNYGPGCTDTADVLVTVNPAKLELKLPPLPTTICRGDSIQINLAPAEPNVTYTWTASTGPAPTGANPVVSPSSSTTYTITATSGQCTKTAATTIQVTEATVSLGPDQTICFGQTVPLTAAVTGATGGTFQWNPGSFSGNPFSVTPLQTTLYTVTYTYGPGCTATDAVTVTVNPSVTLSVIQGDPSPAESICEGNPVKLKVTVLPLGTPLTWTQNGSTIPGVTTDSVTVKPLGDNVSVTYTVSASTAAGCSSSSSISYTAKRCFEVPNAFTPNGDQINGSFGIVQYGGDLTVEYMAIYNRWGQKVFESTRQDQRWDGRFDGKDAPADVYGYTLRVRFPNGDVVEKAGDVTLLR